MATEKKRSTERANIGMRAQFYGTMQNILTRIDTSNAPDHIKALHARVKAILFPEDNEGKEKYGWNRAYSAEKMLAHLRPAASLRTETRSQIDTLRRMGHPAWEKYDQRFAQLYPDDPAAVDLTRTPEAADPYRWGDGRTEEARELLERVLNDVHWTAAQRYHKRGIIDRYTQRIAQTGLVVTVVFLAVLGVVGVTGLGLSPWTGIVLVIMSGLLGAVFSILINSATRDITATIEDLLRRTSAPVISLRLCVGAISAVILYFFFESGLVEGLLFPDLERIGFAAIGLGPPDPVLLADQIARIRAEAAQAGFALTANGGGTLAPPAAEIATILDTMRTSAAASAGAEAGQIADLTALQANLAQLADRARDAAAALPAQSAQARDLDAALGRIAALAETDGRRLLGGFVPNAALCKLMVWSFLAGFSEQLVARMLRRVERGTDAKSDG